MKGEWGGGIPGGRELMETRLMVRESPSEHLPVERTLASGPGGLALMLTCCANADLFKPQFSHL